MTFLPLNGKEKVTGSIRSQVVDTRRSVDATVDVRIERVGSGDRLFLHNGMWGPAACVLHALGRACQDGRISSSKWDVTEINEVTTGAVVRQILGEITDWDWQQPRDSADRERVEAFRDRLLDGADYEIHALEA